MAIVPLAIGAAAAIVICTVGIRLYFQPLPVAAPERLVVLRSPGSNFGSIDKDTDETVFSLPMYRSLASGSADYLDLAGRSGDIVHLQFREDSYRARAEFVTGNYFGVLGLQPAAGRLIERRDDLHESEETGVVLSYQFALARFGSPAAALGQTVRVNRWPMVVIGVAPATFLGMAVGRTPDIYLPLRAKLVLNPGWSGFRSRRSAWLNLFGRFRDGIDRQVSEGRLRTVYSALLADEVEEIQSQGERARQEFLSRPLMVIPAGRGIDTVQRAWAEPVRVLLLAAATLYAVSWFNFGSLVAVRLLRRRRTAAIQISLGARKAQLLIPLAAEVVSLACAGTLAGIVLAWAIHAVLGTQLPPELTGGWMPTKPDSRVIAVAFAAAAGIGTILAMLLGLASFRAPARNLRLSSSQQEGSRTFKHTSHVLLSFQGAGSVVLVIIAVLLSVSLYNLTSQDLGMDAEQVVTLSVSPGLVGYSGEQSFDYYERALAAIRAIPGVEFAGLTSNPVFDGLNSFANVTVEGYNNPDNRFVLAGRNKVSPDFFAALGIPLVSGRSFEQGDLDRKVVVINREFARVFFKGVSPEGRHIAIGSGTGIVPDLRVIGVIDNYHQKRLREAAIPTLYTPLSRSNSTTSASFYVRLHANADIPTTAIAAAVRQTGPGVAVYSVGSLADLIAAAGSTDRLLSTVSILFAVIALLLAATGVLGIVQYAAEARQPELAIRTALGATRPNIVWLLGRESVILAVVGSVIGVAVAGVAVRVIKSLLFGVESDNIIFYAASTLAYLVLSVIAATIPALRGSNVDLTSTLRSE